jgi:hypothetical protein
MKLTDILKEINIVRGGIILSPKDIKDINLVFSDDYGSYRSEFDLYNPISETRTKFDFGEGNADHYEPYDEPEDYPPYQAFLDLSSKPRGFYVAHDIWNLGKCPGAPSNAFYIRLEVGTDEYYYNTPSITLSSPDASEEGIPVGWFDARGEYHPDTVHFNEDGDHIA